MAQAVEAKHMEEEANALEGQSAYSPAEAPNNIPAGTRVKVLVNPVSGKKVGIITTNSAGVDELRAVLEANDIQADIEETEYPGHATELAREAVKQGYDIVIACGGDGTIGETAAALIGTQTTLGILPI